MDTFLAKWQPLEFIALVGLLGTVLVAMTGLLVWRQVRVRQADVALKQELLRRGLPVEAIERVLQPTPDPTPALEEMSAGLVRAGVTAPAVEQITAAFQTADLPTRLAITQVVTGMVNEQEEHGNYDGEQIVAAVRGLCGLPRAYMEAEGRSVPN
jgi:hypothetical protein